MAAGTRERGGDLKREAFAGIVDVGLERGAEARDARLRVWATMISAAPIIVQSFRVRPFDQEICPGAQDAEG
jgi:hypothetical protein